MTIDRRPASGHAGRRLALAARALAFAALAACSSGPAARDGAGVGGGGGPVAVARAEAPDGTSPLDVREPIQPSDQNKKRRRPSPEAAPGAAEDAGPPVEMVTIHVLVEPPQKARVIWGAKDFGLGPLDIRRPRGSGPLDLLVRAPGYLTLHTRAFTDRNNTLSVHLVPEAEATRFPGYQAPAPTVAPRSSPAAGSRHTTAHAPRSSKPASVPARRSDVASDGAGTP